MLVVKQVTFVEQVPFLGSVCLTESLSSTTPNSPHPLTGANPRTTAKRWWRGKKNYEVHFRMETPFEPGPASMAHLNWALK